MTKQETKKTYRTNCICPKCGNLLFTSDIEGYPFVCEECDENFYGIEVADIDGEIVEISVRMDVDVFAVNESLLQEATDEAKADFLGYDDLLRQVDIGWEEMPGEEQICKITDVLSRILQTSNANRTAMDIEERFRLVDNYERLANYIMAAFSMEETTIINAPQLGTVKDGCKKIYAEELRKILAEIMSDYYSTTSYDKLVEYKNVLTARLKNDYNYQKSKTTEKIARNWATSYVIRYIENILELEKKTEIRETAARERTEKNNIAK